MADTLSATTATNMANMLAQMAQHLAGATDPRLRRVAQGVAESEKLLRSFATNNPDKTPNARELGNQAQQAQNEGHPLHRVRFG